LSVFFVQTSVKWSYCESFRLHVFQAHEQLALVSLGDGERQLHEEGRCGAPGHPYLTLQAQQTLTGFRVYQRCAARTPWLKRGACRGAFRSSSAGLADQGDILVRARVIDIAPQVSTTGTLSSLGIGVDGQIVPELAFTYMLTNNIGLSSSLA
jgi:hypothetical protein